jgi:hypothetical protein
MKGVGFRVERNGMMAVHVGECVEEAEVVGG